MSLSDQVDGFVFVGQYVIVDSIDNKKKILCEKPVGTKKADLINLKNYIKDKENIHFFDIESFMECQIKDHSLLIKNTKHEDVELIPVQIRSMITDGTITR